MGEATFAADLAALEALGLFTGVSDIYAAMLTKEGSASEPPTYDTPFLLCETTEAGLTPTYAEGKLTASNRSIRRRKMLTGMTTKIGYPRVTADKRAKVLGRAVSGGREIIGDGMTPKCAIGLSETRDDGTMVMRWILQGEFAEGDVTAKSEEDDAISYQIPTLEHTATRVAYRMAVGEGRTVRPVELICDTALAANKDVTPETFFASVPDLAQLASGFSAG